MYVASSLASMALLVCIGMTTAGSPNDPNLQCEDGWRMFQDDFETPMCFRALPNPLPWRQAQEHCKRDLAHLLNVDPISQFDAFVFQTESLERLNDYIFDVTNGVFWSGMHVKSGRLMWDSYGPEYVKNRRIKSWSWNKGQPAIQDLLNACGHVTQGRRTLTTTTTSPSVEGSGAFPTELPPPTKGQTTPAPPTEVFNGSNGMELSPCETKLPFVCQKPVPAKRVKLTSICPDGWLGNQYLPYCFRIVKQPLPILEAMATCSDVNGLTGGEMIRAPSGSFNYTMASLVLDFYIQNDRYFETQPVPNIWINGDSDVLNTCYALQENIDSPVRQPALVNCDQPLPFMCAIPTRKSEGIYRETTSPFFNQAELKTFPPFATLPVTTTFNRALSDNEILFIHTPDGYINSSQNFAQQLDFNTRWPFIYNVTLSDRLSSPYEVSIFLPPNSLRNEIPARRRRELAMSSGIKGARGKITPMHSHLKQSSYVDEAGIGGLSIKAHRGHNSRVRFGDTKSGLRSKVEIKKGERKSRRKESNPKKRFLQDIVQYKRNTNWYRGHLDRTRAFAQRDHKHTSYMLKKTNRRHHQRNMNRFDKSEKGTHIPQHKHAGLMGTASYKKHAMQRTGKHSHEVRRKRVNEKNSASGVNSGLREKRSYRFTRGLGEFNPELQPIADYDLVRLTTGYYGFGIYTINPPSYDEWNSGLVRYAERDWYVYVVGVGFKPEVMSLTNEEMTSFNLYGDEEFVGLVGEYAFSAMETRPNFFISENFEQPNPIIYYKATPEAIIGRRFKFRVFMHINTDQFSSGDLEQMMLPVLELHWRDGLSRSGAFVLDNLDVRSTVACPLIKTTVNGTEITFPSTRAGEVAYTWERCFKGEGAFASRQCTGGYRDGTRWGNITFNTGCREFPELNQSDSTADLKILSEVALNVTNVREVLNDTINLTSPNINLTEADIIYTAEILYNYWQFEGARPDILDDVYEVANNVLERYPTIIEAAQEITNAANRIIESVEEITSNANLFGDQTLRVVKDFLATDIWDQFGLDNLIIGLKLHNETKGQQALNDTDLLTVKRPTDADPNVTDTAIFLDEALIKGKRSRTVFQIYSKTSLFNVVNARRFELISKVAAARLEIDGVRVTDLGNNSVTAVFRPEKDDDRTVCAFWDYTANEAAGGWATEGCTKTLMSDNRIECRCNHLTNFAVLVDLEAYTISDTDKLILEVITKIGLIISIIGLGLTVLTFLIFKHLRSGRGQQVLINLAVAMLCSSIIFLVGMDRTESTVGCKVVAALLHYFILVSFMWMLVEGLLQYLRFVKVLGTYIPRFMVKTMIPAWGIPVIPVVVVAAIDHDLYFGGNGYCWLARDAMLYAFIIPVAVVLFANLVVFCLVLCNLFRRRSRGMKSNQSERKMAFLHFQAAVSIFVILGLTWVFGFLAIDGARIVFHYLFAICNAFQGFFIFLLFTAREKQIRKAWKKLCCKASTGKAASSSTGTDVNRRKASLDTESTGVNSSNGKNHHQNHSQQFLNVGYET